MKLLGEPLLAHDATGRLKSKVGTVFLKSNGLVTIHNMHFLQRQAWINKLNEERAQAGQPPLTEDEENEEIENSVDLLFNDNYVLIRPDPNAMDLAIEADVRLQALVSKRNIRFLNTQHESVRNALRARGENWRMSRVPTETKDIIELIASSLVAIDNFPLYYYNHSTGTRFLTLKHFAWLEQQDDERFRRQLQEIERFSATRNRFGSPEIDIFPRKCAFSRQAFDKLDAANLPIQELRKAYQELLAAFRQAVPAELQEENPELNMAWRNQMCSTLTVQPNAVDTEDLVQGLSPEFYRQIEWVPGCRIERGEIIFDPVCGELDANPDDAELRMICDPRAKAIIFNYLREYATVEYINIGRIAFSLSNRVAESQHRPPVYLVHLKEAYKTDSTLLILRFQKWDVKERLDDGTEFLTALMESMDYTDYVLDRRLACIQLGMNLPARTTTGRITETYHGSNAAYQGARFWAVYFERFYVGGYATDKLQTHYYADPEFNRRFAGLLGGAAAVNCIVGRTSLRHEIFFDDGDEILVVDENNQPVRLIVSDFTGAFAQYGNPLAQNAWGYAKPVNNRAQFMVNAGEFADLYLQAFQQRFEQIQEEYRRNRRAFDVLFSHRPLSKDGSLAFRWQRVLERLDITDAAELAQAIRNHIAVPVS